MRSIAYLCLALVLGLFVAVHADTGVSREGAGTGAEEDAKGPEFDGAALRKHIDSYQQALDKAVEIESTVGALGVRLHLYPDARHYSLCEKMRELVTTGVDPRNVVQQLVSDKEYGKEWSRLKKKGAFRLELIHPKKDREVIRTRQVVHIFHGDLTKAVSLRIGKGALGWKPWLHPRGLEDKVVRIARHWTVKRGRRVPVTTPLKPKHRRAVMRGDEATIWGTFAAHLLERKKGSFTIMVQGYDEFEGYYTDEHIVNLNEAAHTLERDLKMEARKSFPFFFPEIPEQLEEFLTWAEKQLDR